MGQAANSSSAGDVFPDGAPFSDEKTAIGSIPASSGPECTLGGLPTGGPDTKKASRSERQFVREGAGRPFQEPQDSLPLRTMAMTSHRPIRPANT